MKNHTLWVEKFRSKTLDEYIANDEVKARIAECLEQNDIPHFIFAGPTGTGKTTLAKIIINNLKCDYRYLNASDENGIETIREKVKSFASSATFHPIKIVILDEADFLTQPAQAALRNIIEEHSMNTRFILTCNYLERLIEPLVSRCEVQKIVPPSKGEVAKHVCTKILDVEKVKYEMADVVTIIKQFYPDVRSIIKVLQQNTVKGKLTAIKINDNWCKQLVEILNKRDKNAWYDARQLIINQQLDDYQPLVAYLFEHLEEYGKGKEAEIIIELDEAQWRSKMVPDKEIAAAALLIKLLNILNRKNLLKD